MAGVFFQFCQTLIWIGDKSIHLPRNERQAQPRALPVHTERMPCASWITSVSATDSPDGSTGGRRSLLHFRVPAARRSAASHGAPDQRCRDRSKDTRIRKGDGLLHFRRIRYRRLSDTVTDAPVLKGRNAVRLKRRGSILGSAANLPDIPPGLGRLRTGLAGSTSRRLSQMRRMRKLHPHHRGALFASFSRCSRLQ